MKTTWIVAVSMAILMTNASCTDDQTDDDQLSEIPEGTTLAELDTSQIVDICAGLQAQGSVECSDGVIVVDRLDSEECVETTQRLQNDAGCLLVSSYVDFLNAPVCERDLDSTCPGAELCETYSIDECEDLGEGVCQARNGQRFDAEQQCLVEEPAYCIPTIRGCDDAIDYLESPDGTCWKFSCIADSPSDWSDSSACTQLLEPTQTCD